MTEATGVEGASEGSLYLVIAAGIVRATEVVNVVVAFGPEVVGHRGAGATGGTVATPGERAVVIDDYTVARWASLSADAGCVLRQCRRRGFAACLSRLQKECQRCSCGTKASNRCFAKVWSGCHWPNKTCLCYPEEHINLRGPGDYH